MENLRDYETLKKYSITANKYNYFENIYISDFISNIAKERYENTFTSFHPIRTTMITKDDEYFFNIRANHFVVMDGWIENSENDEAILIMANHKGELFTTLIICGRKRINA